VNAHTRLSEGKLGRMQRIQDFLARHRAQVSQGELLFLTGAGVSAESGIPTFRGAEGYWRIGSRNYFPEELATRAAFSRMPDQIWGFYLYRRGVCRAAQPNPAHLALARLEARLGERFVLVTQNVDGLHLRAGNTSARTFQIHGNLDYMRALHDRDDAIFPVPGELGAGWERGRPIGPEERALLVSPVDGTPTRPHVLWFDESYDERHFRFQSTLAAVERAALVVVVGTAGATNLPSMIVDRSHQRQIPLLVINRDPSPFSELAEASPQGLFIQASAGDLLPALCEQLGQL
jgi:NAD-dependent deacetylase